MSGHSKWHNIQAKKGKTDAARGAMFTKIGRELAVAAKGNPNPDTNSKLADVIAKAKAANMPNENIKRSIAKAAGELGDKDYKELTYEGYGVGGAAVIIKTLTDNVNRTAGDIRSADVNSEIVHTVSSSVFYQPPWTWRSISSASFLAALKPYFLWRLFMAATSTMAARFRPG